MVEHDEKECPDASGHATMGKWNSWYKGLKPGDENAVLYGDPLTYWMAASYLADVDEIEDWGCGKGGFRLFYQGHYIGIDGSNTPFAAKTVDLCTYHSSVSGILIRHVLEHNYKWEEILKSALRSFTHKLCIVLFTPFMEKTTEIDQNSHWGVDVPDLSFSQSDFEQHLTGVRWRLFKDVSTNSQYKVEHVYFIWRDR